MKRVLIAGMLVLIAATMVSAGSTMDAERSWSWSPNLGWVDWHPSEEYGAVIGEFVCSGYLWAPNVGWIYLGDGEPVDAIAYSNESGEDFGVNHVEDGRLRGLAWSANVGWVVFADEGDPRINLKTGVLLGYAWMPNAGWLRLGEPRDSEPEVVANFVVRGGDSTGDGIPDAWRLRYGGSVDSLPADGDASGNGVTNRQAYIAGLDPLDPHARFAVEEIRYVEDAYGMRIRIEWTSAPNRAYRIWATEDFEHWERVGPPVLLAERPVRYFIGFVDSVTAEDVALVHAVGGDVRWVYTLVDAVSATLPEDAIRELLAHPRVTLIEEVGTVEAVGEESPSVSTTGFTHTLDETDRPAQAFFRVEAFLPPLMETAAPDP